MNLSCLIIVASPQFLVCHSEPFARAQDELREESWVGRQLPHRARRLPHPRFLRGHRCGPVRIWSPLRMTDGGAPCTLSLEGEGGGEGKPVLSHHRSVTSCTSLSLRWDRLQPVAHGLRERRLAPPQIPSRQTLVPRTGVVAAQNDRGRRALHPLPREGEGQGEGKPVLSHHPSHLMPYVPAHPSPSTVAGSIRSR